MALLEGGYWMCELWLWRGFREPPMSARQSPGVVNEKSSPSFLSQRPQSPLDIVLGPLLVVHPVFFDIQGPTTMKSTIHQKFYAAIPRASAAASSSSASSSHHRRLHTAQLPFFEPATSPRAPPPSPQARPRSDSSPTTLTTTQHSPSSPQSSNQQGGQGQTHPALALPHLSLAADASSSASKLPSTRYGAAYSHPGLSPAHAPSTSQASASDLAERRYRLDVGAYGVPKRGKTSPVLEWGSPAESSSSYNLATQVGEDAYFVRSDALGVADGVGGWAHRNAEQSTAPTASALFAKRLMHYCSSELAELPTPPPSVSEAWLPPETDDADDSSYLYDFNEDDLLSECCSEEEVELKLDEALEDLSDGLDVLHLLERAYDGALKAHVTPSPEPSLLQPTPTSPIASTSTTTSSPPLLSEPKTVPLMAGSSTALLAVLDHAGSARFCSSEVPPQSTETDLPPKHSRRNSLFSPIPRPTSPTSWSSIISSSTPLFSIPPPSISVSSASSTSTPSTLGSASAESHPEGALLHIAHLGDSAALLVRHGKVVWRTEEMWWGVSPSLSLLPYSLY